MNDGCHLGALVSPLHPNANMFLKHSPTIAMLVYPQISNWTPKTPFPDSALLCTASEMLVVFLIV